MNGGGGNPGNFINEDSDSSDNDITERHTKTFRRIRTIVSSDDDEEQAELPGNVDDNHPSEDEGREVPESSDDAEDDRREQRLQRKRRRDTRVRSTEDRRKLDRDRQMSLLKKCRSQKSLRAKETKNNDEPNRNDEFMKSNEDQNEESSSDDSWNATSKKWKRTAPRVEDSASEESDREPVSDRPEPEIEEPQAHCSTSTCHGYRSGGDEPVHNQSESIAEEAHCSKSKRQQCQSEERTRMRRLDERLEMFKNIEDEGIPDSSTRLVLDYDEQTKKPLVTVDPNLVAKLKPHQKDGVKFMWNSCFESIEQLKLGRKGGGCILAHCMGLGKTLQVVSLVHTLLTHEETGMKSVLILCPAGTILNWISEFKNWLVDVNGKMIEIYTLTKLKEVKDRVQCLEEWFSKGGVMVMGYAMYRILVNKQKMKKDFRNKIVSTLQYPGCDVVICDEGHKIKNRRTVLTKTLTRIRTMRRILLTGTPLQNNLMECYCMVNFVRPHFLGSEKSFQNHYGHTIHRGQFRDSEAADVSRMKSRSKTLSDILSSIVQRRTERVLTEYLPMKREFVVMVNLSSTQAKLYSHYLNWHSMIAACNILNKGMTLLNDFQKMRLIWSHPLALRFHQDEPEKKRRRRRRTRASRRSPTTTDEESDAHRSESSDDEETAPASTGNNVENEEEMTGQEESDDAAQANSRVRRVGHQLSSDDENQQVGPILPRRTILSSSDEEINDPQSPISERVNRVGRQQLSSDDEGREAEAERHEETQPVSSDDEMNEPSSSFNETDAPAPDGGEEATGDFENLADPNEEENGPWWSKLLSDEDMDDLKIGPKVILLLSMLEMCERLGDKMLVFSPSLPSLDVIEHFLKKSHDSGESWVKGVDYFRLDGDTPKEKRAQYCDIFNDKEQKRARLFLISTEAGGVGINLQGANRAVIFDASWNPSSDIQSIFRLFRFGQTKPTYVYRFVAQATMEEPIFTRQITKLSIARRIIDEEQLDRHFTREEVGCLYRSERRAPMSSDPANMRRTVDDYVMAELLRNHQDLIVEFRDYDSFLENNPEEELTELERSRAEKEFNRTRAGGSNQSDMMDNVKEKIRAALRRLDPSGTDESLLNTLYERLAHFYDAQKKKRVGTCISGRTRSKFKWSGSIVMPVSNPIFDMNIRKAPDEELIGHDNMLTIRQQALLHALKEQSLGDTDEESKYVTRVLTRSGSSAEELEADFLREFDRWYQMPTMNRVGTNLVLHFVIPVRVWTLEEKLAPLGITVTAISPGFEAAESLLAGGVRLLDDYEDDDDTDDDDDDDDDGDSGDSGDNDDNNDDGYDDEYSSDSAEAPYYDPDEMRKMTKSFIV